MKRLALIVALACVALGAFAQDFSFSPGLVAVRFYGLVLDCGIGFSTLPDWLSFYALAGGGYYSQNLARDYVTGDPTLFTADYSSVDLEWEFGAVFGLDGVEPDGNFLEAFLLYRGRWRSDTAAASSAYPEIGGLLATQILAGIGLNGLSTGIHNDKSGVNAQASIEYGPGFLNGFDYLRLNAQALAALPLFDIDPEASLNLLNAYLVAFADIDWATGTLVPIFVAQSMGGRNLRGSLGDNVRGYPWKSYDTAFKAYGSLEARVVGPAMWLPIYFVAYFFADAGYYAGFDRSSAMLDASGFLASAGCGLLLDVFAFAQIGYQVGWRLVDDPVYALSSDPFFHGLKIMFHF